jgi:hypothetical protein
MRREDGEAACVVFGLRCDVFDHENVIGNHKRPPKIGREYEAMTTFPHL